MNLFQNGCKCKLCQQFSSRFSVQCLNIEFTISNGNLLLSVGFFPILLFLCFFGTRKFDVKKKRLLNSEHISFCQYPLTIALSHSTILCVILKPKYSLHFGFGFISVAHFLDIFLSISLLKAAFRSSQSELTHSLSSCIAHTPKNRLSANLALNYEIWHLNISIFSDRIQWEIQIDSVISLSTCKLHISKCFEVC